MKNNRRKHDRKQTPPSSDRVLNNEGLKQVIGGGGVTHLDEWNNQT